MDNEKAPERPLRKTIEKGYTAKSKRFVQVGGHKDHRGTDDAHHKLPYEDAVILDEFREQSKRAERGFEREQGGYGKYKDSIPTTRPPLTAMVRATGLSGRRSMALTAKNAL